MVKVLYKPGSKEESEYLERLKGELEEEIGPGLSVDEEMGVIDSLGSEQAQEDFVSRFESLPVTDRERVLDEMDRVAKLLDRNAMEKNYQAISLQLRLWEQRAKIEGMYKVAESKNIDEVIKEKTRAFVERGVHHLFELVGEKTARRWVQRMTGEGF